MDRYLPRIRQLLYWGVLISLLSRTWQFVRWDPHLRNLFWNAGIFKPVTDLLGIPWKSWVTSPLVNSGLDWTARTMGVFFAAAFVLTLISYRSFQAGRQQNSKQERLLLLFLKGSVGLTVFWAVLQVLGHLRIFQFPEYAAQIFLPLCLIWFLQDEQLSNRTVLWAKIAIALTFAGHALFALGIYPTPGKFVDMSIRGFGISESAATGILHLAGLLDLLVAVGIFLPFPKVLRYSLYWAFVWGLLTSLARVYSNWFWDNPLGSLDRWLFEAGIRSAHFILPLVLLLSLKERPAVEEHHSSS
jgi:hypothetical protein